MVVFNICTKCVALYLRKTGSFSTTANSNVIKVLCLEGTLTWIGLYDFANWFMWTKSIKHSCLKKIFLLIKAVSNEWINKWVSHLSSHVLWMLPVGILFTFNFPNGMKRGNETTNCPPDEPSRNGSSPGSPARSISSSC